MVYTLVQQDRDNAAMSTVGDDLKLLRCHVSRQPDQTILHRACCLTTSTEVTVLSPFPCMSHSATAESSRW